MRRVLLCWVAAAAGFALLATQATVPARADRTLQPGDSYLIAQIDHYRKETWRWQRLVGREPTPSTFSAKRSVDPAYRHWVLDLWKRRAHRARRLARPHVVRMTDRFRSETWHWQKLMGKPRTPRSSRSASDLEYHAWVMSLWRERAARARRLATRPPRLEAWLCIQRHEGSWDDSGAPYYGGLQMDLHFQRTYGADLLRRKGTADKWTPLEQIWVAERAFRSGRGFYPWPNTARNCGLI